jgi:hypothetical protein
VLVRALVCVLIALFRSDALSKLYIYIYFFQAIRIYFALLKKKTTTKKKKKQVVLAVTIRLY